MPSSTVSSASSVLSSSPSYASVLASQSGSISSPQTSITRSSSTSSLSSLSSLNSCSSSVPSSSSFSPKSYLTVHDLYMRYAPLKSLTKSTTSQVSLPRVLPPMTLKDLFNKFAPKSSATTLNPSSFPKIPSPPSPQSATPSPQNADNAEEEAPAKTHVSTVDKQGGYVAENEQEQLRQLVQRMNAIFEEYGYNTGDQKQGHQS